MKKDLEIILLGKEKVGKTQIVNKLISEKEKSNKSSHSIQLENYNRTYSPNERHVTINLIEENKIKEKNLIIYDLPGTEKFNKINDTFLRTAKIIFLVYDMTNIESFMKLYDLNNLLYENDNVLKCVIANKSDLIEKRMISEDDGKKFAKTIRAHYFETNVFSNINNLFSEIVYIYSKDYENKEENDEKNKNYKLKKKEKKRVNSCCDMDNRIITYDLKITNAKKEKELIKFKNGNTLEIFDNNPEKNILTFNDGDIFKGKIANYTYFDTGILKHNDFEVNFYNGKMVNIINVLIFCNNKNILNPDNNLEQKYFNLENNFVMKVKFIYEKFNPNENNFKDFNLILFICDKFENEFINNFKLLYNKIIQINKGTQKIGIISYKNNSKNKEIIHVIKSLNNVFHEVKKDEIELKEFLNYIKNKYLNNFEKKVLEDNEGTYFGNLKNNVKEGIGIMVYEDKSEDNRGIYIGNWKNNYKEGHGKTISKVGTYIGEWKNDFFISGKFIPFGVVDLYYEVNGTKIEGFQSFYNLLKFKGLMNDFSEEKFYGTLEIKNGIIYEGKLEKFNEGEGTISYPNGDIYKGEWKNFRKNGKGIIFTENGTIIESEWEKDKIINNKIQIKNDKGDLIIGEIFEEEEENEEEKIILFKLDKDFDKYSFEKKLNLIEEYLSKFDSNNKNNAEFIEDIGKRVYEIEEIYEIWKKGKASWTNLNDYINEAEKILFFKDYYKNFFRNNEDLKEKILKKVNDLIQNFFYARKYKIFKNRLKLICDEKQNIDIIEKNNLNFDEIDFFEGILDNKGIDLEQIFKKIKGIIKYNNGDIYKGYLINGKKNGKGIMIYENGKIFEGYWENDMPKENLFIQSKLLKYYNEKNNNEKNEKIEYDEIKLTDTEFNEYIDNIDLKKQYCQIHKHLIIGLCIDKNCEDKNKLVCQKCFFKEHKKHDIVEIDEYNDKLKESIIKSKKLISDIKDMNKNKKFSNNEFEMKISELKKFFNSLIEQKIESFICPIFEKLIKENENILIPKIIKLKNNYPINSLENQIEISNLIFSSLNANSNIEIDFINDIFNIKIKNIKNEIKEKISLIFDNKNSNLYEIENYWIKEVSNSNEIKFSYELEENDTLARKKSGDNHSIQSKLKLKEGNIYIFLFNIIYKNKEDFFEIGFENNHLLPTEKNSDKKRGISLTNKGLFIDGININEKIKIENGDEICFILSLKEEKYFTLNINEKYIGKFRFNLMNIYAFASIEKTGDSIKLRTFIEL